jgi:ABC-type bacteriocin/lantibiotic exporter with double-glycine peptidase domain
VSRERGRVVTGFRASRWVGAGARILVLLEREGTHKADEGITNVEIKGELEFDHVTFEYSNDDGRVLEDISMKIDAGTKVSHPPAPLTATRARILF